MGLGLYVARRLMEEQGGELLADDCPTGGARFLVRFPVEERRAVAARTDRTRGRSGRRPRSRFVRPTGARSGPAARRTLWPRRREISVPASAASAKRPVSPSGRVGR